MKKYLYLISFIIFSIILVSCSDDDDSNTTNGGTGELLPSIVVKNLRTFKPEQGDTMTYFSLRENKVIDKSRANTTDWDICFHRTNIYVNQGYRGPGNGGAFVLRQVDYETLAELPKDSVFYEEVSETQRAIPTGSGKGWYNYNHSTFEITPIPGVVLAIRTADGRYAKLKILSYYAGYPDSIPTDVYQRIDRTYSFKYVFQPNGTKKFTK